MKTTPNFKNEKYTSTEQIISFMHVVFQNFLKIPLYNNFSIQNKFNWDVNEVLKVSIVKNMDTTSIKKKEKKWIQCKVWSLIYLRFILIWLCKVKICQNIFYFPFLINLCFWEIDKDGQQRVIYSNYIYQITNNKKHEYGEFAEVKVLLVKNSLYLKWTNLMF